MIVCDLCGAKGETADIDIVDLRLADVGDQDDDGEDVVEVCVCKQECRENLKTRLAEFVAGLRSKP